MSILKKKKKLSVPSLLTYTYANVVFLFLFFFLLMTNYPKNIIKSQFNNEKDTPLTHLERKTLITLISIQPSANSNGSSIQINDSYATVDDIYDFIMKERASLTNSDKKKMIVSLRIDKNTNMELVNRVKQALLKAGITKVDYRF
jgi:biopolymer transport protein ExbD